MSRRALVNILIISCTSGVVALLALLAAALCHKYAKARRKAKQAVLPRGSLSRKCLGVSRKCRGRV